MLSVLLSGIDKRCNRGVDSRQTLNRMSSDWDNRYDVQNSTTPLGKQSNTYFIWKVASSVETEDWVVGGR